MAIHCAGAKGHTSSHVLRSLATEQSLTGLTHIGVVLEAAGELDRPFWAPANRARHVTLLNISGLALRLSVARSKVTTSRGVTHSLTSITIPVATVVQPLQYSDFALSIGSSWGVDTVLACSEREVPKGISTHNGL
jgi:hypothetical protein